jgi:hypothetical protein
MLIAVSVRVVWQPPKCKKEKPRFRGFCALRARNETRTRDPNLGKVVLYQLSYSRMTIDELIVVQK